MNPTSPLVEILISVAAVGLLVVLVRSRHTTIKLASAALALLLGVVGGVVGVNDYFGYYQSWLAAYDDLSGKSLTTGPTGPTTGFSVRPARDSTNAQGTVEHVTLAGKSSGITRSAYVYLPPQYGQAAYRHTRFPVIELLHGTPGKPADWIVAMHINRVVDQLVDSHQMGPIIMVAPTIAPRGSIQECLNTNTALDETYINTDVPHDMKAEFRTATDPAQWAMMGISAGGYCATNLGLHHPAQWGAVISLDGYYLPSDGDAQSIINRNPQLAGGNNPIQTAARMAPGKAPLPAFYLAVGTGNSDDVTEEKMFAAAMVHLEQVQVDKIQGGQHTFYDLRQVAPTALKWAWNQLSTPDLKVTFPITGGTAVHTQTAIPIHTARSRKVLKANGRHPDTSTAPGSPRPGEHT